MYLNKAFDSNSAMDPRLYSSKLHSTSWWRGDDAIEHSCQILFVGNDMLLRMSTAFFRMMKKLATCYFLKLGLSASVSSFCSNFVSETFFEEGLIACSTSSFKRPKEKYERCAKPTIF
jgi:hypothetical protein